MRPLSPRELVVLALYEQGLDIKEIADILKISIFTVAEYSRRICRKLGARSLRHAIWLRKHPEEISRTPANQPPSRP
jgi:DNA-binding CsgD family transcriptional regulator